MNETEVKEFRTDMLKLSILTGHTCGEACWEAREDICRCSCGGRNHGILRTSDGKRPERTCKNGHKRYILAAVVLGYNQAKDTEREITREYMPNLDWCAYGEYRDELQPPIMTRKASDSQKKWQEVQAIDNPEGREVMLIWRIPDVDQYITKTSVSKFYSPTGEYIPPVYAQVGKQV